MKPEIVATSSAPAAIGPYSQAVKAQGMVYCSGQIALDPATGQIVGSTIYLVSMADFAGVNEVYGQRFPGHKPARATVAVKELPKGGLVEIDCIAIAS